MTRSPLARSIGASSADAASGSARNTASAAKDAAFSGTTVPSQIFESAWKAARRAGGLRAGGCGES
jgi:hypothetical protein